jgi:hypothetical protein
MFECLGLPNFVITFLEKRYAKKTGIMGAKKTGVMGNGINLRTKKIDLFKKNHYNIIRMNNSKIKEL